jgi:hypothetical protein
MNKKMSVSKCILKNKINNRNMRKILYVLMVVVPVAAFATFAFALSPSDLKGLIGRATAHFVFNDAENPVHISVDSAPNSTPPQVDVHVNASTTPPDVLVNVTASTTPPNVEVNLTATATPPNIQVSANSGVINIYGSNTCPAGLSQIYSGNVYLFFKNAGSFTDWRMENGACWQTKPSVLPYVDSFPIGSCAVCQK